MKRVQEAFKHHDAVMVQMPTGTGKTMVLANIVFSFLEKCNHPIWIVAHRRELVSKIKNTIFSKITPSLFTLKEGNFSNHPVPLSKEGSTSTPSPSSSGSGDVAGDAIALPEFWSASGACALKGWLRVLTQQSCDCLSPSGRLYGI